ncbi:MAG: hypothetical protein IPJ75_00425 [Ignavibacteriales bacterium]|nr:hypothetical protein [Ignavibacteriales bacterium]
MNYTINKIDGISVFTLDEIRLDANISGLVKGEFTSMVKENSVRKW